MRNLTILLLLLSFTSCNQNSKKVSKVEECDYSVIDPNSKPDIEKMNLSGSVKEVINEFGSIYLDLDGMRISKGNLEIKKDENGKILSETYTDGNLSEETSYLYDSDGLIIKEVSSGLENSIEVIYSCTNELPTKIRHMGESEYLTIYDKNGFEKSMRKKTYGISDWENIEYYRNSRNLLDSTVITNYNSRRDTISKETIIYDYIFDKVGNWTKMNERQNNKIVSTENRTIIYYK